MEFRELIAARRSIRAYVDRRIEPEKVQALLAAANAAPSAGNLQAYEIVLVEDAETRAALRRASHDQDFITAAPLSLVVLASPARSAGKYGKRGGDLYCVLDAAIACAYIQLAATDLGLGSVWVGAFVDDAVRVAIGAPDRLRPVAIIPVGYPAESPAPTPRRKLTDLVRRERF